MKKLFTLFVMLHILCSEKTAGQYFEFDYAVMFANSNYNQGFRAQSLIDVTLVARNTDPLDIGIAAPYLLSTGNFESPVWGKFDAGLNNTLCGGSLTGTDNVFIFDSDVSALGSTLITGHYTGSVTVNANTYTCGGGGTCGFAAVIDPQCQVTDFLKLEGTQSITINKARWDGSDMLLGIRYQGSFTNWGATFNAAGSSDAALAKVSSLTGPSATLSYFSGNGGETVQSINPDGNFVYTSLLVTPPAGPVTMTYPGGTQTLNLSSRTNSNELLVLDNNLTYQSHVVIGSNSGPFEIKSYYKFTGGFYIGGTMNYAELYPDPVNTSFSIAKQPIQSMIISKYDAGMNYVGSWCNDNESILHSFNYENILGYPAWLAAGQENLANKQQDGQKSSLVSAHGVVYIFDDALHVIDSLVIGSPPGGDGFCMFFDADLDASGSMYVTGFFNDSIDLDPDTANQFILAGTFGGYGDIVLAKYDASALGIPQPGRAGEISIFPNPFSSVITVSLNDPVPSVYEITVTDLTGRKIYARSFSARAQLKTTINLESFSSGVYLLEAKSANSTRVRKIIRQ